MSKTSLILCHFHSTRMTAEEFLYPTHCLLKVCFGVCVFETQLWQNYAWKSVTIILHLWAQNVDIFRPSFTEFKYLCLLYWRPKILVLQLF